MHIQIPGIPQNSTTQEERTTAPWIQINWEDRLWPQHLSLCGTLSNDEKGEEELKNLATEIVAKFQSWETYEYLGTAGS